MTLSSKQVGVLKGMASAMLLSIISIWIAVHFDPFNYSNISLLGERLAVLGLSLILPTLLLIVSIGRLARFRFFSPEDIDGSGLTLGSAKARVLQSLLQNTLEQFVIMFGTYTAWVLLMPASWLSVVPVSSVLFAIGRLSFFKGYSHGASARALGFALTFYSTALMFFVLIAYQLLIVIS